MQSMVSVQAPLRIRDDQLPLLHATIEVYLRHTLLGSSLLDQGLHSPVVLLLVTALTAVQCCYSSIRSPTVILPTDSH